MTPHASVKPIYYLWKTSAGSAKSLATIWLLCSKSISNSLFLFLLTTSFLFIFWPAFAQASTGNICDQAAKRAAAKTGVPISVLWSITRTETGRSRDGKPQPWPWTVNMEGVGKWFDTEDAAKAYVFKHFKRGARSFDIGCFQINYKWHGTAFRSIDQMFDPLENAQYAASFLLRLYLETGDWSLAAGAYHSRTSEHANRYRARFDRIRKGHSKSSEGVRQTANLADSAERLVQDQPQPNNYPLLKRANTRRSIGSLVPLADGQSRSLFQLTDTSEGS